jgi:O-antigen ligase
MLKMKESKCFMNKLLTNSNIVIAIATAIFLPYILSAVVLVALSIYIIVNSQTRKLIINHKGSKVLLLFFAYAILISCIYSNWLGVLAGVAITLAFVLGLYMRSVMTSTLFEKILSWICLLSISGTIWSLFETVIIPAFLHGDKVHRASAQFFYPNYFGNIVSIVIIICAYKVVTRQGKMWIYYAIAFMNVISLYLCKSMFAWVEIFLGVAMLLIVLKKHKFLALWLLMATVGSFVIIVLNIGLIPRLSEAELTTELRFKIWDYAILQIKNSPFFGHGFMSYMHLDKDYHLGYLTVHSHSITLELLMNFGIVGTGLFLWYFIEYVKGLYKVCIGQKKCMIYSLILAITAASMIHGLTDLTLMWIQTLPFYLLILAGLGAYEN